MSVIGDYFVFGTANLWAYPNRVAECLENDTQIIENANTLDTCGNDRSDNDLYRCLEDGVYANSIIVLNKHSFETELALPTQGVGNWANNCYEIGLRLWTRTDEEKDQYWWDNDYCAKYTVIPEYISNFSESVPAWNISIDSTAGINGDVSSVATYYHEGTPYGIFGNKMGYFWIVDLDAMEVRLSTMYMLNKLLTGAMVQKCMFSSSSSCLCL